HTPRRRGKYLEPPERDLTVEAGGPIIRDHLFVYGLAQFRDNIDQFATIDSGQLIRDKGNDPFYGLKVDGYLTPTQHLEFTLFDTSRTTERSARAYSFDGDTDTIGEELPGTDFKLGGVSYVAKYTGTFTDWLTVSAAYGKNKDRNETVSSLGDSPLVQSVVRAGPSGT